MVDKRISDLEATTTLEDTTVFHIRKTETNEDFKITKSNLVKQIGNSVVNGFNATSPLANILLLTPSNSGSLDQYYEGMTIKFISPINSTDLVKIKIGTLGYIDFKTTFTNPITNVVENGVLKTGKFYEAIYSNNSFIQTNIDRQYTNEYLSIGEIMFDNNTQEYFTLYTLTSATSFYKTSYYEGMSIVFTSGIINNSVENMSNGKIYIDVDGLGQKLLSDPDGDGVPFSLQPNETILGIYDGEKFIKNMFTMQEPELPVPVDPINPPPGYNITVYVGPNEPEVSNRLLQTAYNRIIKDYGHDGGGRKVLIKFRDDYTGQGFTDSGNLYFAYTTIEGNSKVVMFGTADGGVFNLTCSAISSNALNITGDWKYKTPETASSISNQYPFISITDVGFDTRTFPTVNIKNASIENINSGNQNRMFLGFQMSTFSKFVAISLNLENVEIKNFASINYAPWYPSLFTSQFCFANSSFINVSLVNNVTQARIFNSSFLYLSGSITIDGLYINISKPSNYIPNPFLPGDGGGVGYPQTVYYGSIISIGVAYTGKDFLFLKNCNIVLSEAVDRYICCVAFYQNRLEIQLDNCTINNNNLVNNFKGSIFFGLIQTIGNTPSKLTILGNDFVNKNTLTTPDITISGGELFIRSSTTTGSTSAINGGKITVIQ